MSNPLKIMLSGPGLIGRQHARLIENSPRCRLAGVVAPPSQNNSEFCRSLGVPLFEDVETALHSVDSDGVIISSPNKFHAEQAGFCVERGIPTLVEKPVTDTLESAKRLADLADNSGTPVLVGHHRTYSPLLEVAKRFLDSPEFGRPVALQGSALFYKPAQYFLDGPWRTKLGGGPLLINLIHEIGIMRFLFGEIVSAFADASNEVRGFEVEDTVAITLRFKNGALGSFILSDAAASNKSWEMTSGENPAYPHHPQDNCYHFAGSNGSLDFPSMQARSYSSATPSWWSPFKDASVSFTPDDPLKRQLDHFLDVIEDGATPRVSARDGYINMLLLEALRLSIHRRRVIDLHEISDIQG